MKLRDILLFLDGKKVKSLAITTATASFCVTMGYIPPELGTYISTIAGILLGVASHQTPKVLGSRRY